MTTRNKLIVVRMTAAERELARSLIPPERNLSDHVREQIFSLPAVGRDPSEVRPKRKIRAIDPAKDRIAMEIARIGANLNQIAKVINTRALSGSPIEVLEVLTQLQAIREDVAEISKKPNHAPHGTQENEG